MKPVAALQATSKAEQLTKPRRAPICSTLSASPASACRAASTQPSTGTETPAAAIGGTHRLRQRWNRARDAPAARAASSSVSRATYAPSAFSLAWQNPRICSSV